MDILNWLQQKQAAYKILSAHRKKQLASMSSAESFNEFIEIWNFAQLTSKIEFPKNNIDETVKLHSELVKKFNALK